MRKLMLVLAMLLVPAAVAAQEYPVDRGSMVLGGSVSWSSAGGDLYEGGDGDRLNTLLLNPEIMYFIAPGLAIGGELYVQRASQGDADVTTIAVGPAISYYFGGPTSSVYPFLSAMVGYADMGAGGFDASGLAFGATGGAAFMLSNSVALTGGLTYQLQKLSVDEIDESVDGDTFALQFGIQAFLF